MIADEVLHCRCGREVKVVRLGSGLALGHTVNPRNGHHPVTLARPAAERSTRHGVSEDSQPQLREREGDPVTEPRYNATRREGNGRARSRTEGAPSASGTSIS